MPNWVTHKLTITGRPETLQRFLDHHLKSLAAQLEEKRASTDCADQESEPITVMAFYPDGTIKEEIREPSGAVLDFETLLPLDDNDPSEVWGTKWNASMGRIEGDPSRGTVTLWFDTPWSIPEPIFDAIAEKYPDLKGHGYAFDELWNFAAEITVGDGAADVDEAAATVELFREVYGRDPDEVPDHATNDEDEDEDDPERQMVDELVGYAQQLAQKHGFDPSGRPLNAVVQMWLDEQEWSSDHSLEEDSSQFQTGVQIASQSYRVFIDVNEDSEQVAVFFYTPFNVPADRVAEMAVLLNWLNYRMRFGRLVVPATSEPQPVQWKALIDVEGSELSQTQIATLISAGIRTFEQNAEILALVALTKTTAAAAIKAYEEAQTENSQDE